MSSNPIFTAADNLSRFNREKTICVETYRKTGVAVRTPVWFAEEEGELFVRSISRTGKVKRIRNSPKVRVAACIRVTRDLAKTVPVQSFSVHNSNDGEPNKDPASNP